MALIDGHIRSQVMDLEVSLQLVLPEYPRKVLYLFHDNGMNETSLCRQLPLEELCGRYGIGAVIPDLDVSCGVDTRYGDRFGTFLSQELPRVLETVFGLSRQNMLQAAGIGSGGYGALHLALSSERVGWKAAAIFSPVDLRRYARQMEAEGFRKGYEALLIGGKTEEEWRLTALARKKAASTFAKTDGKRDQLWMYCGPEDEMFQENEKLRKNLTELGLDCALIKSGKSRERQTQILEALETFFVQLCAEEE